MSFAAALARTSAICLQARTVASRRDGGITVADTEELCHPFSAYICFLLLLTVPAFFLFVWMWVFTLWVLANGIGLLLKRERSFLHRLIADRGHLID